MISLIQAIIAFVLLGLGTFYYFKTRSPPETPKSGDFDPLEEVEAEPDIKPAKPTPAVTDEPVTDLEPEVIVTPSKPEPENEDEPVKPTPATTPAKPLVPEKPKPTPKPVVFKPEPVRPAVEEPEQPTPSKTPAKPLVPEKPKPKPVTDTPLPPDVFMDKQYTLAEAKAKCASIGRRLCSDPEICGNSGSTIFQKANGGNIGKMFRTWVGGKNEQACNDNGKNGAWRYVGSLAANRCYFGPQFERCGVQNQKLEGFACCGKT